MANLQKYDLGEFTLQAAEAEAEQLKKKGSKDFDKLKVGDNVRRILPGTKAHPEPYHEVSLHYVSVPGKSFPASFPCPRIHAGRQCADCDEGFRLYNSGTQADKDAGFELLPKAAFYYNVIDMAEQERGVLVGKYGKKIHEALVEFRRNPVSGGNFTDPLKGFDIVINRVGTGMKDTKYFVSAARVTSPLANMEWLNQRHDLSRFAIVPDDSAIAALKRGDQDGVAAATARDVTPQATTRQLPPPSAKRGHAAQADTLAADDDVPI